jgi:hypothetical protein
MWLYKRKKRIEEVPGNGTLSDKVAGKIAYAGIKMQNQFAKKMNNLFMKIDFTRLKLILVLFCLCAGGYSIYLVANSIISADKKQNSFEVQQMDIPKHFNKTGDELITPDAFVDEQTYQQIEQFKQYMDSLKNHQVDQYDSILQARPGLMDSVQMLEQIYLSQKQK